MSPTAGVWRPGVGNLHSSVARVSASLPTSTFSCSCTLRPAGDERADADHGVAVRGGLRWELVREGEVSTRLLTKQC